MRFSSPLIQLLNRGLPQMHDAGRERFERAMEQAICQVVMNAFDERELDGFHVERMTALRLSGLPEQMNLSFELSEMLAWGLPRMLTTGRATFEAQLERAVRQVVEEAFDAEELSAFHVATMFDAPARKAG